MIVIPKDMIQAMRIDEVNDNLIYIGYAEIGTADNIDGWTIKKISISGAITFIMWANGNNIYNKTWNDRATLEYI